nr:DUF4880 domain-containing protein [Pseudomonas morbosilactucae]
MQWQLDLQEPEVSSATLAAWQRWRQAHPQHEQAWQRAEALTQRLQQVRSQGHSELARATLAPNLGRRRALKQLGLLLAAGAGAWAARDTALMQDWSADYSTQVANNDASPWPTRPRCSSTRIPQSRCASISSSGASNCCAASCCSH